MPSSDRPGQSRPAGPRGTEPTAGWPQAGLESLIYEATALFHRAHAAAEQIHRRGRFTAGQRGVLRGLELGGPQTVPQMARIRPVSRQYIQMLVNQVAREGYVEFIDNPAHKRSRLVRLSEKGREFLHGMYRREAAILEGFPSPASEEQMRSAAAVLRAARELFESPEWGRRLKSLRESENPAKPSEPREPAPPVPSAVEGSGAEG